MKPQPKAEDDTSAGATKLRGRVAVITGGDSGIGRAVAISFAKEGADVALVYLDEDGDAEDTRALVEKHGARCLLIRGDVGEPAFCKQVVDKTVRKFGRLDILVNNAGEQHPQESLDKITPQQLERTFRTNIFSMFHLTAAALPHLDKGSTVINTTSVTAYRAARPCWTTRRPREPSLPLHVHSPETSRSAGCASMPSRLALCGHRSSPRRSRQRRWRSSGRTPR